jgi:hypothetical protein
MSSPCCLSVCRPQLLNLLDVHVVHPPNNIWVRKVMVEWYWQRRTRRTQRKTCPSATLSTTNFTGTRNRASAVSGRRLTAWAMTGPQVSILCSLIKTCVYWCMLSLLILPGYVTSEYGYAPSEYGYVTSEHGYVTSEHGYVTSEHR